MVDHLVSLLPFELELGLDVGNIGLRDRWGVMVFFGEEAVEGVFGAVFDLELAGTLVAVEDVVDDLDVAMAGGGLGF